MSNGKHVRQLEFYRYAGRWMALTMRGDLQLLGGTNITYVLKDSPLTVQDRMSDMVTFTSFTDTLPSAHAS